MDWFFSPDKSIRKCISISIYQLIIPGHLTWKEGVRYIHFFKAAQWFYCSNCIVKVFFFKTIFAHNFDWRAFQCHLYAFVLARKIHPYGCICYPPRLCYYLRYSLWLDTGRGTLLVLSQRRSGNGQPYKLLKKSYYFSFYIKVGSTGLFFCTWKSWNKKRICFCIFIFF